MIVKTPTHHFEHTVDIPADVNTVFDYLDDPARLGAHMRGASWMMAGSHMDYEFDAAHGKARGALIHLSGKLLGLTLAVDEVVSRREPPFRKTWRTVGRPRLLVIGHYEMGFLLEPGDATCRLTVHLTHELPTGGWRLCGWLLGGLYARWCVRRMANDAARHFATSPSERRDE